MSKTIEQILAEHPAQGRQHLIPLLQEVQDALGYLSRDSVGRLGEHLGLPASKIYGVATFYNQFRFRPLGRYHVQVCRGTACHVKGSLGVFEALTRHLGIGDGETTRDGLFSLEIVACLGACGLAPLICVGGRFHGQVTAESVVELLESYREEAAQA